MTHPLHGSHYVTRLGLLLLLLMGFMATLQSCSSQHVDRFHQAEIGMSKDQIRDLLGKPSSVYFDTDAKHMDAGGHWPERWQYGDTLSTNATGALFPENAPDKVWVIYFDPDGTVSGTRVPEPSQEPWRPEIK